MSIFYETYLVDDGGNVIECKRWDSLTQASDYAREKEYYGFRVCISHSFEP